jgi:uncharacterized coiled-coil DUF342 family protein
MNLSDIIKEVSYTKFKSGIQYRTQSEQLHKAIKDVKLRLQEIDKIMSHTAKLKSELTENDEDLYYWKYTDKNIQELKVMTQEIYKKIHSLIKKNEKTIPSTGV